MLLLLVSIFLSSSSEDVGTGLTRRYSCLSSFPFSFFSIQRVDTIFSGPTGLGKSTLINTIFASHLIDSKGRFVADEPVRQTTEIQAVSHGKRFFFLPGCIAGEPQKSGNLTSSLEPLAPSFFFFD